MVKPQSDYEARLSWYKVQPGGQLQSKQFLYPMPTKGMATKAVPMCEACAKI